MYNFTLTNQFLSQSERLIFNDFLKFKNLEPDIWPVFESLFKSGTTGNTPLLLRVYKDDGLYGAAIIIKCSRYGRALFNNKLFISVLNRISIPFYLWIRFGCCMDMMSNPGFVKDPAKADEVVAEMGQFLKRRYLLTFINDYSSNADLYTGYSILPALPHALVDTSKMKTLDDYLGTHKNIRRKMNILKNKGGAFEIVSENLNEEDTTMLEKCFVATAEKSVFYLPYQDLYLNSAKNTSRTRIKDVYYFIVRLKGKFLGYQAAIKSGSYLNALHGAFDRNRQTNYHAYNILFVEMTRFAIEHGVKIIDFGAILNSTKQRMVNTAINMSYFIASKYKLFEWIIIILIKFSKIQGKDQMKYRNQLT